MKIGVTIIVCSFIYSVLVGTIYFLKPHIKSDENKIYNRLFKINLVNLVLELLCCYFVLNHEVSLLYESIATVVSRLFLLSMSAWIAFFTFYIYVISFSRNKKYKKVYDKKVNRAAVIFMIVYIFVAFFEIFLPLSYWNTGGYVYSYGPATNILLYVGVLSILFDIYCILKNIEVIKTKKYIPLVALVLLMCFAAIIRTINPGLIIIDSCFAFITVLMYFTIENPDVKMVEQLNMAKDQAEKANKAKTDFLSSMSHEIRTPLNAIVGFSKSLSDNAKLPAKAKSDVKDILIASDNLLEIVNGVLDISKIEANRIEIIDKEYDTSRMFKELSKLTKVKIGEKPIKLKTEIDESIPDVLYGDHVRVKQVILNVLTNAAKYTDKGTIDFKVHSVKKGNVCRLIISVEDTGHGIKKENIDKLFNKFERLEEDRNTTIEGTGLGLAITKKLLELMNGKIVVQSEYGKGSKFTISIDQAIVKKSSANLQNKDKSKVDKGALKGKKVLIVDDNQLNIKVATRLLEPYELKIESLLSGLECIDLLKEKSDFDLILLDDMMPKQSGTETLKIIKKDKLFDGPIVMLTANALTGMRDKYIESGFDDYLAKPIEQDELDRVLKKYLK